MNELRELEIDTTPSKIINLLDFKPEKLTKTKNSSNNSSSCKI